MFCGNVNDPPISVFISHKGIGSQAQEQTGEQLDELAKESA